MPENNDTVTMTRWELEKEREHAVITERLKQLDEVIPNVYAGIKALDEKMAAIPMEIVSCRDRMDADMKKYMHDEFVTAGELRQFESKLERKMTEDFSLVHRRISKASWTVSGFIAAATLIFWILAHTNISVH